ncbi:zinc finger protein 135-like [Odontomachus brunneus]|uniref:zinc finger protein 135-like n=1 Tax=Odontomachus brunneus TaxID=486640 RepID=UPI0013F1DE5D|nr:zinc finger protein 135-like [Odontomachus brunneus]
MEKRRRIAASIATSPRYTPPTCRVLNGNGYFLYGKESIPMLPWQIVDLEGNPYYAFLPANEIPKTEEKSQLNSKPPPPDMLDVVVDDTEEAIVVTSDNDMTYTDSLGNFYTMKIKDETTKDGPFVDENEFDNDVYTCEDCNICFPVLQMLKQHRRTMHMEKMPRYKCKLCPKICRSSIAFRMHMNLEHNKEQNTDEQNTDEQNTDEQNIDEQNTISVEKQSEIYRCDFCNYETINKSTFKSHINRKHSALLRSNKRKGAAEPEEYTCDGCSFKCQSKRRLKEHLERKHLSEYKYSCEYCSKKFKVRSDMRLHVRFKHKEGPLVCDVCGKTCSNSNSLYVHQKWAHFKPKYECKICKRRMVTQKNLDQHILLQHKCKESFVCEECGKSFSENHRLKQHMMTHTGDRPFDCHICNKAFSRRTAYRQHLLIHTGKRPYVCDICGKSFTQKPGLICHRKSHPGVHPPLPVVYIDHILNDFMKNK